MPTDSHRQTVAQPPSSCATERIVESDRSRASADRVGPPRGDDPAEPSDFGSAGEPLPQSDWPAFEVPTCVCGCAIGDHRSVWVPAAAVPTAGTCLRCECQAFTEKETR